MQFETDKKMWAEIFTLLRGGWQIWNWRTDDKQHWIFQCFFSQEMCRILIYANIIAQTILFFNLRINPNFMDEEISIENLAQTLF